MDLLWCIKYESCKKNDLGQPHGQREAHLQGGHHEWHVYPVLWGEKIESSQLMTYYQRLWINDPKIKDQGLNIKDQESKIKDFFSISA